jgi:hypothetical protein
VTGASDTALGQHLLDSGPLLCLGGSPLIADLYDAHFGASGGVVAVVAEEVRRLAKERVAPGDPRRIGPRQKAGTAAVGRYQRTLFASVIEPPSPEPEEIADILQALEDHATRKRPGRQPRAGEHAGETYSIYEAETRVLRFVANDDGARHVAGIRKVKHESFVGVAHRLAKCQQDVKPKQLVKELQRLSRAGIDTGDVVHSVLDLTDIARFA